MLYYVSDSDGSEKLTGLTEDTKLLHIDSEEGESGDGEEGESGDGESGDEIYIPPHLHKTKRK